MLELAVVLGVTLLVALGPLLLWRRLLGPRQMVRRLVICCAIAFIPVVIATYRFINARGVMAFGRSIERVETDARVVALTFDDGPLPGATERVLEHLRATGGRATFFVNGEPADKHPELVRAIAADGHELGNHTWSHMRLVGRSVDVVRSEIERTDEVLHRLGWEPTPLVRAPYGKKFLIFPWVLDTTHRRHVTWDVEAEADPAVAADSKAIVRTVLEQVRPGSIILMHVMAKSRAPSLEAVPELVRELHARGYRTVTVSELLADRVP